MSEVYNPHGRDIRAEFETILRQRIKLFSIKSKCSVDDITVKHGPCGATVNGPGFTCFVGAPVVTGPTNVVGYNRNPFYTPPEGVR